MISIDIVFLLSAFAVSAIVFSPRYFFLNPSPDGLVRKYLRKEEGSSILKSSKGNSLEYGSVVAVILSIKEGLKKKKEEIQKKGKLIKISLALEIMGFLRGYGIVVNFYFRRIT